MNTPICDFVSRYAQKQTLRLHMPGHKGKAVLGPEMLDITEVNGADSLFDAAGIIRESEENAGRLFGCTTFYSAEGSSLCIRAMLHLIGLYAAGIGRPPRIAAARNVHKTFLSAVALLDMPVDWLCGSRQENYLCCPIDPEYLEDYLANAPEKPVAVYITSPDYTGYMADIAGLSAVCRRHGVLLAVDNAHGAYLRFLPQSMHPMDLGAHICCDSAHKTLPVLTGGAYLHIGKDCPPLFAQQAKSALALFGSTSPSYLILQSLDKANVCLAGDYPQAIAETAARVAQLKAALQAAGYALGGNEPLKVTLLCKPYGYTGAEMAAHLEMQNMVCEFADPDMLVMMFTPQISLAEIEKLEQTLLAFPKRPALPLSQPAVHRCQPVLSIRQAMLSPRKTVPIGEAVGKILATASVGCPPAVPIAICGERLDETAVELFRYYGVKFCDIVK